MNDLHSDSPPHVCIVIPTCDNCGTVGEVVRHVEQFAENVIVVNDGSTDDTAGVLEGLEGITVVTHKSNRGKGEALASGFVRAAGMGFTHAITLDADGQHLADDLPGFLEAITLQPDALIVGTRDLSGRGRPLKSRLLRANSNFWVWLETGKWVPDTQSGYRAYPLQKILDLKRRCHRYDFEVEVLVRAIWAGVPVAWIPVRVEYGPGSTSHFRPCRDFALVFHLNGCLLLQRVFLPGPVRAAIERGDVHRGHLLRDILSAWWQGIADGCEAPGRFASAVGLGVMFGILPIWGFQIAAAVIVSDRLKLNKPLTVVASNVSFPAMIPLILYLSLMTGRLVLMGNVDRWGEQASLTTSTVWDYATVYLVGSVVLAMCAGLATYVISLVLARVARCFLRKRQQCD